MLSRSITLALSLLLLVCTTAVAQQIKHQAAPVPEKCKADQRHAWLMANDPAYAASIADNEATVQHMLNHQLNYLRNGTGVLTVPVVVHVIHTGQSVGSGANISDAQVQSAIDAMNDDFRKVAGTQGDGDGVDTEIEFCLASTDPNGGSTSGINRVDGTGTCASGDCYDAVGITDQNEVTVKNLSKWPNTDYYNIWIVTEIDDNGGGSGTQGYAYFPGASATYDGAVILYNAFGYDPTGSNGYNLKSYTDHNRTVTHELGHGLNLYHTFEGDAGGTTCPTNTNCNTQGDRVCDTDPQIRSASNCPGGTNSCTGNPNSAIVENYMDYSSETCTDMFSQDQKDRMRAALCGTRASLLNSSGCAAASYCTPTATNGTSDGDFIDGVVLGSINNTGTGAQNGPYYNDYTAQSTTIIAGSTYDIDITGGSYQPDRYAAWIDYNQDNDFEDPGEKLGEFTTNATFQTQSINFTVPSSATAGPTRLRVRCNYNSNQNGVDPCDPGDYGEVEDYTVDIISYCIPNPTTGTSDGDFIDGVALGSINNTGTGSTTGPNYVDYTDQSTNLNTNSSYNIAITGGSYQPDYYAAWIDYNQDGDFTDSGEKLGEFVTNATFQTQQIPFTVPGSALAGSTRLRVRCVYSNSGGNLDPCANGNWGETEDYTVDISTVACPTIVVVSSTSDPSCGQSDGSITATPTGGSSPYTFAWSNGGSTTTINNLTAGTYTVNISDANNCPGTATYTLANQSGPTFNTAATDLTCSNASDGEAQVTGLTGTAPFTFQWSNGGTSNPITGLTPGPYTVTVTDANGCQVTSTVNVAAPTDMTLQLFDNQPSCGQTNGSATLIVSDGQPPYTYLWDFNTGNQTSATASGLGAGTFFVTVTDDNGCTSSSSVTLTSAGAPVLTVNVNDVTCNGQANGSASVLASNGSSPYTYTWSSGTTGAIATSLGGGTYTVTVTGSNGCSAIETVTVNEAAPMNLSTAETEPNCGSSNGAISANVSGGNPPYSYQWSNGQNTSNASGLTAGNYTLTVTDAQGCTQTTTVGLTTAAGSGGPTVSITSNNIACNGQTNGSAAVNASSGTPPYTYAWDNGSTQAIVANLPSGTYSVTVTDNANCTTVETVAITEPTAISATSGTTEPDCGSNNGSIAVSVGGGTSPYSYLWSDGQTTPIASGLTAGTYDLTITDGANCEEVVTVALNNDPSSGGPTINTTSSDATCYYTTDGTAAITVSSGQAPYSYAWDDGFTQPIRTGLEAGVYAFTVTDAQGCVTLDSVEVDAPDQPLIVINSIDADCGSNNGSATATVTQGVQPYIYIWDASTGLQTTQTATGLGAGMYAVTITEGNGCETEAFAQVANLNAPTSTVSSNDVPCFGGSDGFVSLSVSGGLSPYTYLWSNGSTGQNLIGVAAGVYDVTITDASGCQVFVTDTVSEPDAALSGTFTVTDASETSTCDGSATITVAGGTAPYMYQWDDPSNQTGETATNLCAATYNITVTDANGCTYTETTSVGVADFVGEYNLDSRLYLYPNPTNGQFWVESTAMGTLNYRVYNSTGKLIDTGLQVNAGRFSVDLSNHAAGLYHIEFTNGQQRTIKRVSLLK